eukprot:191501-Pleurochrysis_carterae.AAC.1
MKPNDWLLACEHGSSGVHCCSTRPITLYATCIGGDRLGSFALLPSDASLPNLYYRRKSDDNYCGSLLPSE